MTYDEIKKQLDSEYDCAISETLAKLKKKKPLTKHKLAELFFKANKAYWAARLALLDSEAVDSADRLAMSLAVPYATAAQTFSDRVRNIYAGYQSAFDLTQKDAKELLDKVVYDRTIAESLQKIAENMPDGEDKARILAEISAPAYRYRLQRAEQLAEQAKEVCNNIARGEIDADRKFLQTETEKAYNITVDEALRGTPADAILDEILPEPIQLRFNEMPKASEPVQDFTPTEDKGVLDSFSLTSTKHVSEITETDWKGRNFSDSVWNNTDKLAQEIKQVLIEGELTGKSEADMAAKIVERFEVGMHAARRVVRTESNYCTNQAELKGMKDAGFDEYEFISLGEEAEDVCRVCDDLDGQRFKIADAVVGVNCPPMHPFCRCKVTTPQQTEEDIQREIDERIDSWNIPEGMSLDEFIERVNNGELEQIRAEQEKSAESVDISEKSDIMEVGKEEMTESNKMSESANNVIAESDSPELASNAHPRNEKLEEVIKQCIEQEHPVFADDLKANFLKIPKEEGKYIVAMHGTPNNVFLYGEKADEKILANIIRNRSDYKGEKTIVLISCNTGNTTDTKVCFAQKFANEIGKNVLAPTEYGAISPLGRYYSSTFRGVPSGKLETFMPNEKEGKT